MRFAKFLSTSFLTEHLLVASFEYCKFKYCKQNKIFVVEIPFQKAMGRLPSRQLHAGIVLVSLLLTLNIFHMLF